MHACAVCLVALLATGFLAQPVRGESVEGRRATGEALCGFVRSAATQARLEPEASDRLPTEEILGETNSDQRFPFHPEKLSFAEGSGTRADRELFESSLSNWLFFEDLAPEQRAMIRGVLARCGTTESQPPLPASLFRQLHVSQRATFVGVTHAMLNTDLVSEDGTPLGDAFQLVEESLDIQGENIALAGDQQFQLTVRLKPDGSQKLERAAQFQKGENHIFHKDYPVSFRQFRKIGLRGQEAGLHICITRDGLLAQIHIDYRFGLLHLGPANSDVRAQGNHQRHAERWPVFGFVMRLERVRRTVLHGHD